MNTWRILAATVILVSEAGVGVAGEPELKFTPQQQKQLDQFQSQIAAPPPNPADAENHLRDVRNQLGDFLAAYHAPSGPSTDTLAATLVAGSRSGQIGVSQSVGLAKELFRVLKQDEIRYQDVRNFTSRIDPLVQSTGLRGVEKMRLYSDALSVIRSAPTYHPDR